MKIKALWATVFAGMVCFSSGAFADCSALGSTTYTFEPAGEKFSQCVVGSAVKVSSPPIICHVTGASQAGSLLSLISFTDHLALYIDDMDHPVVLTPGFQIKITPSTKIKLIDKNPKGLGQATIQNKSPDKVTFTCGLHAELGTVTEK